MSHRSEKHPRPRPARVGAGMFLLWRVLETTVQTKMTKAVDRPEPTGTCLGPLPCRGTDVGQWSADNPAMKNISICKIKRFQFFSRQPDRSHRAASVAKRESPPARAICINRRRQAPRLRTVAAFSSGHKTVTAAASRPETRLASA